MKHLLQLVFFFVALTAKAQPETIQGNYKRLAAISAAPNPSRANLDTIRFPWTEYSKGALGNALWRTVYLSAENEAKLPSLVKPPSNSSDQVRAELDYMLDLQAKRTATETERVNIIANIGSWPNILNPTDPDYKENREHLFYIASPLGKQFNPTNFPVTTQLLLNCIQDIRVTEFRLKQFFKRPRPYHLEPKLQPLARISSPAFPSGHSLWAFTQAFLFSEIVPEQREAFYKMAEEVRWSREYMGIHYPSDNEASRILGWYLVQFWYHNPAFKADIDKARSEYQSKKHLLNIK